MYQEDDWFLNCLLCTEQQNADSLWDVKSALYTCVLPLCLVCCDLASWPRFLTLEFSVFLNPDAICMRYSTCRKEKKIKHSLLWGFMEDDMQRTVVYCNSGERPCPHVNANSRNLILFYVFLWWSMSFWLHRGWGSELLLARWQCACCMGVAPNAWCYGVSGFWVCLHW